MGLIFVIILLLVFDYFFGMGQILELVFVQVFVLEVFIEVFDEVILSWFFGLDQFQFYLVVISLLIQSFIGKFWFLICFDSLRIVFEGGYGIQSVGNLIVRDIIGYRNVEVFFGEVIYNSQVFYLMVICQCIYDEIYRLYLVWSFWQYQWLMFYGNIFVVFVFWDGQISFLIQLVNFFMIYIDFFLL